MGARILLVGEDPLERATTGALLAAEGYEVISAESGVEAAGLMSSCPDLVLLDLPSANGRAITLAEQLHRQGPRPGTPVVIVTQFGAIPDDPRPEGVRRFIYKPCRPSTLLDALSEVLRYSRP